jgi:hypothetical protein
MKFILFILIFFICNKSLHSQTTDGCKAVEKRCSSDCDTQRSVGTLGIFSFGSAGNARANWARSVENTYAKCSNACRTRSEKCVEDIEAAEEEKNAAIAAQRKAAESLREAQTTRDAEAREAQTKRDAEAREAQTKRDAREMEARADRQAAGRAPDIALICRPVAVSNYQTSSNNASNRNYSDSSSSSGSNSGSNSSYACGGQGWENKRVNFSIWINERRCNGVVCNISANEISFNGISINRITGMASDQCHTYTCDRVSSVAPKF